MRSSSATKSSIDSQTTDLQIGIDSFAAAFTEDSRTVSESERLRSLIDQIEYADKVGLDSFGIGAHHRKEFLDSAPPLILAAAAARTQRIRLTSAVTVLSAADPVRLFQEFATVDLLSGGSGGDGRGQRVVNRGVPALRLPAGGLRRALRGEARPAPEASGE